MNGYGIGEIINNAISLIYTKIFYHGARLIRRPIYVRGRRFLKFGKGFTTGYNCRIEMFDIGVDGTKKLLIGRNCKIGDYVHIAAGEKVIIGDSCLLASKIYISDISHGNYSDTADVESPEIPPDERKLFMKPVQIGDNVWIGENVSILPGVTIGNGCIIGANTVVTKDIPDACIVVGNPGKIIKKYNIEMNSWVKYGCK